ncbi:hypothetical protein Tco_1211426 [Tanacetum coccineum]
MGTFRRFKLLMITVEDGEVDAQRGPIGLSKWVSIIGLRLAPPEVLLLRHGARDFEPDMSFDTSASPMYFSDLGHASLAKVVSRVPPLVAPEEIITHQAFLYLLEIQLKVKA